MSQVKWRGMQTSQNQNKFLLILGKRTKCEKKAMESKCKQLEKDASNFPYQFFHFPNKVSESTFSWQLTGNSNVINT